MPSWINRTQAVAARNGTTSHSLTFTAATAGSLLMMIVGGGVTTSTPSGWTARSSAVNNTGLYVFTKTATSGESSASVTHNGSNYPISYAVYEFASGSTYAGTAGTATNSGDSAWAAVTSLPGTAVTVLGAGTRNINGASATASVSATSPWVADVSQYSGFSTTDGSFLAVIIQDGVTTTSATPVASISSVSGGNGERITVAVSVAAGGGPTTIVTTQSTETDTPLGALKRKLKTTTQATATEAALAATHLKQRLTGQALEADTLLTSVRRKLRTTGQSLEADTPLAAVRQKLRMSGQTTESDTVLAATRRKIRATGQALETDTAFSSGHVAIITTGQTSEGDMVLPGTRLKRKQTIMAFETDIPFATALKLKRKATGQVQVVDAALTATRKKIRLTGVANEVDLAQAAVFGNVIRVVTGQVLETDAPFAALKVKRHGTLQVAELDAALATTRVRRRTTGQPAELDHALLSGARHRRVTGLPVETDVALPAFREEDVVVPFDVTVQRRITDAFIQTLPVDLVLTPHVRIRTNAGGYTHVPLAPRGTQTMRLNDPGGPGTVTRTEDGIERDLVYELVASWDAELAVLDTFTLNGDEFEVIRLFSELPWEKRGEVRRRGR